MCILTNKETSFSLNGNNRPSYGDIIGAYFTTVKNVGDDGRGTGEVFSSQIRTGTWHTLVVENTELTFTEG